MRGVGESAGGGADGRGEGRERPRRGRVWGEGWTHNLVISQLRLFACGAFVPRDSDVGRDGCEPLVSETHEITRI